MNKFTGRVVLKKEAASQLVSKLGYKSPRIAQEPLIPFMDAIYFFASKYGFHGTVFNEEGYYSYLITDSFGNFMIKAVGIPAYLLAWDALIDGLIMAAKDMEIEEQSIKEDSNE